MSDTPIKYIVKEKSLIGNEIFEAGAEVELPEGCYPAGNLEPICERGKALQDRYFNEVLPAMHAKQRAQYGDGNGMVGDMSVLSGLIAKAVAQALADQKQEEEAAKLA